MIPVSTNCYISTVRPLRPEPARGVDRDLDYGKNSGPSLQTATTIDFGSEQGGAVGGVTELKAITEALKDLTSLPQGKARLALVQQLSEFQFLYLLADCKDQLTQLGLTLRYPEETDPE